MICKLIKMKKKKTRKRSISSMNTIDNLIEEASLKSSSKICKSFPQFKFKAEEYTWSLIT